MTIRNPEALGRLNLALDLLEPRATEVLKRYPDLIADVEDIAGVNPGEPGLRALACAIAISANVAGFIDSAVANEAPITEEVNVGALNEVREIIREVIGALDAYDEVFNSEHVPERAEDHSA